MNNVYVFRRATWSAVGSRLVHPWFHSCDCLCRCGRAGLNNSSAAWNGANHTTTTTPNEPTPSHTRVWNIYLFLFLLFIRDARVSCNVGRLLLLLLLLAGCAPVDQSVETAGIGGRGANRSNRALFSHVLSIIHTLMATADSGIVQAETSVHCRVRKRTKEEEGKKKDNK